MKKLIENKFEIEYFFDQNLKNIVIKSKDISLNEVTPSQLSPQLLALPFLVLPLEYSAPVNLGICLEEITVEDVEFNLFLIQENIVGLHYIVNCKKRLNQPKWLSTVIFNPELSKPAFHYKSLILDLFI